MLNIVINILVSIFNSLLIIVEGPQSSHASIWSPYRILYATMLLSPLTRQTVVKGTLFTLCFLMNLVWITIFLVGEVYASVCGCFDAALAMVSFLFDFFDMCPLQSVKVQEQFHWYMHSVNHNSG